MGEGKDPKLALRAQDKAGDNAGAVRRETVRRMTRRCAAWDYRQRAIYMITLVLADRSRPLLGRLVVDDPKSPPEAVTARVEPSELGAAVLGHWRRLGEFAPEVKPLYCQLMPDHLHAIVEVTRPMAKPLGNVIGGFKTGCEKIYRELARASGLSRLFAPGFQDSVLFRAGQLDAMFAYLRDNPRRLAVKRLYPDLFRVVGELRRPLPSLGGVGAFMALGNRFLLDRPLVQVQVSRRDFAYRREAKRGGGAKIARDAAGEPLAALESAAFAAKCESLLAAARQGATLLSPCVSDGEREVARRAFAERLPLVVLRNKGFAPLEKPSGRYFDACADGRLLMLAPAAWPHLPGEKPIIRRDALVMNRLAQALAGAPKLALREQNKTGDRLGTEPRGLCSVPEARASGLRPVPLRYHGVTFADVDDWAREAVRLCSMPEARASGAIPHERNRR